VRSIFSVPVEPLPSLAGFGVAAVCLSFLQSPNSFDDLVCLVQVRSVGADDRVSHDGVGWLLVNCSTDRGSVAQPFQKLPGIHPEGIGAIVGAEVIPEAMILGCLAGGAPLDRAIVGGTVQDQFREDAAHDAWLVACEL